MTPRAAPRARRSRPRHWVVTAGPTREHIDPVRYLTNESSGKMGFAIARAARKAGGRVTLIAGPVNLETPAGVTRVDVVSAREMLAATREAFETADVLVMAAAVSDWRPRRKLARKWRKESEGGASATLDLVRNPDILATVARKKGERLVIGFALETEGGVQRALEKMERKGTDLMILNDASALNAERTTITVFGRDGSSRRLVDRTKDAAARELVGLASDWSHQA